MLNWGTAGAIRGGRVGGGRGHPVLLRPMLLRGHFLRTRSSDHSVSAARHRRRRHVRHRSSNQRNVALVTRPSPHLK